jgi:hypothetical protein
MEAASLHKHQPFDEDMLNSMQLYMGNWIVFHEYMQSALGDDHVHNAVAVPADVDDVYEEAHEEHSAPNIWSQDEEDEETVLDDQEEITVAAEDEEEIVETGETEEGYDEEYLDEHELEIHDEELEAFADENEDGISIAAEADDDSIPARADNDEALILPIYTEDYFLHQGIQVSNNIPAVDKQTGDLAMEAAAEDPK